MDMANLDDAERASVPEPALEKRIFRLASKTGKKGQPLFKCPESLTGRGFETRPEVGQER